MVVGRPERVGHRGAPRVYPANTLKSFAEARRLGCDRVECDVRLSQDGALVLAHDPHVQDVAGRDYHITAHTRAELATLDLGAGEGVPTLEELVTWAQNEGDVALMVDMKDESHSTVEGIAATLTCLPTNRKCVSGASRKSRYAFRQMDPALPLLFSLGRNTLGFGSMVERTIDHLLTVWADLDADGGSWEHPLVTPERVTALRQRGAVLYAWTVDDPEVMQRMIACGVTGITSNRPDLLSELIP